MTGRLAVADGWFQDLCTGVVIFDGASDPDLLRLDTEAESVAFSPEGTRLWGLTPKSDLVHRNAMVWPLPVSP